MSFSGHFAIDKNALLQRYRDQGFRLLGYVCSSTPEEVFRANGYIPVRIMPRYTGSYGRADRYLPPCVCSHARCMLNGLLQGLYEHFDAFFFSSNCTTIRCLQNQFQRHYPGRVISDFIIPSKAFEPEVFVHLRREVERLDQSLKTVSHGPKSLPLDCVIEQYRENRRLMAEVMRLRRARPGLLNAEVMNELYEYNTWVDKAEANSNLAAFIEQVVVAAESEVSSPTVFVLGNCCGNNALLQVLDDRGCRVVGDLLSTGEMAFLDVAEREDPYASIAARLTDAMPCPAKLVTGPAQEAMIRAVQERVKTSGADAIILVRQKFCDSHALDRPFLLPRLRELGLPLLEIETAVDLGNIEQIYTRIDAFLEMFS